MKFNFIIILLVFTFSIHSQEKDFIQVTGSAEMLVEPNEFTFVIEIEEYWEEEFETKKVKKYKTKVNIKTIESKLIQDLNNIGINPDIVKSTNVGNTFRYFGKDFLVKKELEIILNDFEDINKIISKVDRKGIKDMKVGELRHTDITQFRKEVKIQAILAAKEKAKYLLAAVDEEIGKVISITEVNPRNYWWETTPTTSNSMMSTRTNNKTQDGKSIRLRFEIIARFEIK